MTINSRDPHTKDSPFTSLCIKETLEPKDIITKPHLG